MPYRLVISTSYEHLFEVRREADLRDLQTRFPHDRGFVISPVSGCEARQYVREGRAHTTALRIMGDGKVINIDA